MQVSFELRKVGNVKDAFRKDLRENVSIDLLAELKTLSPKLVYFETKKNHPLIQPLFYEQSKSHSS